MDTNPIIIRATGRITNLWKEQIRTDCLIQGVKQADQYKIEKNFNIQGSNGTYVEFGEYLGTALYVNITVYDPPFFEFDDKKYQVPQRFRIDCYEATREAIGHKSFGKLAIFDSDIDGLTNSMKGEKTTINFCSQQELINDGILKIIAFLPFTIGDKYPFYGAISAKQITNKL